MEGVGRICVQDVLANFFETGVMVSGAGVEANKTPSSGGQVCELLFHHWVKLAS